MTRNTIQRLSVFIIGVPLFAFVELYASFGRNMLTALVILFIQYMAVKETAGIFAARNIMVNRSYLHVLASASSIAVYFSPWISRMTGSSASPMEILFAVSTIGSLASILPYIFSKKESFPGIMTGMTATLFSYFYCGFLGACFMYIATCFSLHAAPVLTFALMSFGNDSMAWLTGVTLGRRRGFIPVSPSKSIAGFIGGMAGSVIAAVLAFHLFPDSGFGSLAGLAGLGLAVGVAVIGGDLVESALKRSAGVKDSSTAVPGRGGILDSFDSLLFSAPLFLIVSTFAGYFQTV
jgi:phosphatidate cytidylyltransferase